MKRSRSFCTAGCGRRAQTATGVCWECEQNRPVPQPNVDRLPDAYLAECVEEALRRQKERDEQAARDAERLAGVVVQLQAVSGGKP